MTFDYLYYFTEKHSNCISLWLYGDIYLVQAHHVAETSVLPGGQFLR